MIERIYAMAKEEGKSVRKLGNYGDLRTMEKTRKMDDIAGKPVTITAIAEEEGRFGTFLWLTVLTAEGETYKVQSGGSLINKALREVKEADAFPVEATFVKRGNAWVTE